MAKRATMPPCSIGQAGEGLRPHRQCEGEASPAANPQGHLVVLVLLFVVPGQGEDRGWGVARVTEQPGEVAVGTQGGPHCSQGSDMASPSLHTGEVRRHTTTNPGRKRADVLGWNAVTLRLNTTQTESAGNTQTQQVPCPAGRVGCVECI
jgi:hypothetical protein